MLNQESCHPRKDEIFLTFNYTAGVLTKKEHINHRIIKHPKYINVYRKFKAKNSIPIIIKNSLQKYDLSFLNINKVAFHEFPPWTIPVPNVDLELTKYIKNITNIEIYKNLLSTVLEEKYSECTQFFCDGSKLDDERVGCAFNGPNIFVKIRLKSSCSIHTAELLVIKEAVEYVNSQKIKQSIIFVDSLSSLQSLTHLFSKNLIVQQIQYLLYSIHQNKFKIHFLWIPSHSGIKGNEEVDHLAKSAAEDLNLPFHQIDLLNDQKIHNKNVIKEKWSLEWADVSNNKLRDIKSDLSPLVIPNERKYQVALTRVRIGHSTLTHVHLINKTDPPMCEICQERITIDHIICKCPKYSKERKEFKISSCLKDALEDPWKIIEFLKLTNLIDHL